MTRAKLPKGRIAVLVAALAAFGAVAAYSVTSAAAQGRRLVPQHLLCDSASFLPHDVLRRADRDRLWRRQRRHRPPAHISNCTPSGTGLLDMTPGTHWIAATDNHNAHNLELRSCPSSTNACTDGAGTETEFSPICNDAVVMPDAILRQRSVHRDERGFQHIQDQPQARHGQALLRRTRSRSRGHVYRLRRRRGEPGRLTSAARGTAGSKLVERLVTRGLRLPRPRVRFRERSRGLPQLNLLRGFVAGLDVSGKSFDSELAAVASAFSGKNEPDLRLARSPHQSRGAVGKSS